MSTTAAESAPIRNGDCLSGCRGILCVKGFVARDRYFEAKQSPSYTDQRTQLLASRSSAAMVFTVALDNGDGVAGEKSIRTHDLNYVHNTAGFGK